MLDRPHATEWIALRLLSPFRIPHSDFCLLSSVV